MKISEYLQRKHNRENPSGILQIEAYIFNIPYPTTSGWFKQYGNKNITVDSAILLINYFSKQAGITKKIKHSIKILNEVLTPELNVKTSRPLLVKKPILSKQSTKLTVNKFINNSSIDPTLDSFLFSFEWKAIRKMALNLHGSKCQCCGASPKTGSIINVDHIKSRKFYPELALDINNLQVLCSDCNHGKGNWDMTDHR